MADTPLVYPPGPHRYYEGGVGQQSIWSRLAGPRNRAYPRASSFISTRQPGYTGGLHHTFSATTGLHGAGMTAVRDLYGVGNMRGGLRFLGPAFLGLSAYSGYKEGGITGAVGAVAQETAMWYLSAAALKVAGYAVPMAIGAAATGGLFMAATGANPAEFFSRPYVNDYMKKRAKLEMGTPIADPYGQVATMRQRSIMAMNNSRINGRTALGNESYLFHR